MIKPTRPSMAALQAFESAARTGSFTRAAAELRVTQGAISRQIRQLEEQLGVRLFDRVRQRAALTAVGRRYRDDVRRTLDQLELATERAMARIDLDTVLTLAVTPTFGSKWLAPRLPAFAAAHPHLSIDCLIWLPRAALGIEQFDAAIVPGRPTEGHVHAIHLVESELLPMCRPEYRAAHRIRTPSDLLRVRLLQQANRPSAWADWFAAQGIAAADTIRGPRFELTSMLMEAAMSGLGVALLPACLTERERATGLLTTLPTRGAYHGQAYYLAVPESKRDAPRVAAFQRWIVEQARGARTALRRVAARK
jgi:LysR family transcriptional regulator, glycine cleavage system transcriptional activator